MGEIAEMMLDGTLCECCGSYIDEEGGDGFPRYCSPQCDRDRGAEDRTLTRKERAHLPKPRKARTIGCPHCKRSFASGFTLNMHRQSMHERTRDVCCPDCDRLFGSVDKRDAHHA